VPKPTWLPLQVTTSAYRPGRIGGDWLHYNFLLPERPYVEGLPARVGSSADFRDELYSGVVGREQQQRGEIAVLT
jgi:hypothetical protein